MEKNKGAAALLIAIPVIPLVAWLLTRKKTETPPLGELTLFENYMAQATSSQNTWGPDWDAQPFIPLVTHKLTKVRLFLLSVGYPAGDFVVSVRAIDALGRPTGPDLAVGSIPCSSIGTTSLNQPYAWYEFDLGDGCLVEAGVKYAIVWRAPSAIPEDTPYFAVEIPASYPAGWTMYSEDYGVTWYAYQEGTWVTMFQELGYAV